MIKAILNRLAKTSLWILGRLLCDSLRIKKYNALHFEEVQRQGTPSVIAFWHGSMLLGWYIHRPRKNHTVAALVSQSKDGEILSATLERWGYAMIRGSSHVGGKEAMVSMVDCVTKGNSLCITPDGPTGPRHEMKMGAVLFKAERGELYRDGRPIRLTDVEQALLAALARRPGQVLSREELIRLTGASGGGRAIDVQVTRLRRKIEDDPKLPRYLQTVRGKGYVLRPD